MIISRFSTWTFVVFLLISLVLVVHLLFGFITPIVMATVVVSIFYPIHQRLLLLLGGRNYLASIFSTVIVFLCFMIPLAIFMIALFQQGLTLFYTTQKVTSSSDINLWLTSLKEGIVHINEYLAHFNITLSSERIIGFTTSISKAIGQKLYSSIGFIAGNLLSLSLNFLLTVALAFVFFLSGSSIKKFIMEIIPLPDNEKDMVALRFNELAQAVFVGNGLISILEGFLGGLSFVAVGISGSLIWGVLMSIAAFLPVVGASIIIIPATIYLFLINKFWLAIFFLIFNTLQLTILETLVKPKVIGTKSQMHAALVFMAIVAGVQLYGPFGLFYGPLLVTVFLALTEIYKEHYQKRLLKD